MRLPVARIRGPQVKVCPCGKACAFTLTECNSCGAGQTWRRERHQLCGQASSVLSQNACRDQTGVSWNWDMLSISYQLLTRC